MLTPPQAFIQRLNSYDPKLVVGFNTQKGRWVIARKRERGQGMSHIMTVQEPDGGYRPLDERTLRYLRIIDSWRVGHNEQTKILEDVWNWQDEQEKKRINALVDARLDRLFWAFKKDMSQYNLGNYTKVDKEKALAYNDHKHVTNERQADII